MPGTTFPIPIASPGWRAAIGWLAEGDYGFAPTNSQYNWLGACQDIHATIDKQPILVYRMDGMSDFPVYILKGQRNVELSVTYWPQALSSNGNATDLGVLNDMINGVGTTNAVSHALIVKNYDTGTVYTITGCIANTVTINGRLGQALEVVVDYWCQNIMMALPAGATFPSDPQIGVPFYFSQESVGLPSGTPQPQTLTFTGTITNNLQRVFQFGKDYVRTVPSLTRKAEGSLTATFATLSDYPNEGLVPATAEADTNPTTYTDPETAPSGLSQQTITLKLGVAGTTSYALNYSGAVLPKIDLDTRISDLIALSLNWTATGVAAGTTTQP
jgi:hypothetical protein